MGFVLDWGGVGPIFFRWEPFSSLSAHACKIWARSDGRFERPRRQRSQKRNCTHRTCMPTGCKFAELLARFSGIAIHFNSHCIYWYSVTGTTIKTMERVQSPLLCKQLVWFSFNILIVIVSFYVLHVWLNSKLSVKRAYCFVLDVKIVRMFHKSQGLLLMIVQMWMAQGWQLWFEWKQIVNILNMSQQSRNTTCHWPCPPPRTVWRGQGCVVGWPRRIEGGVDRWRRCLPYDISQWRSPRVSLPGCETRPAWYSSVRSSGGTSSHDQVIHSVSCVVSSLINYHLFTLIKCLTFSAKFTG